MKCPYTTSSSLVMLTSRNTFQKPKLVRLRQRFVADKLITLIQHRIKWCFCNNKLMPFAQIELTKVLGGRFAGKNATAQSNQFKFSKSEVQVVCQLNNTTLSYLGVRRRGGLDIFIYIIYMYIYKLMCKVLVTECRV